VTAPKAVILPGLLRFYQMGAIVGVVMKVINKWFTLEQLQDRWDISDESLEYYIEEGYLPFYYWSYEEDKLKKAVPEDLEAHGGLARSCFDFDGQVFLYDDILRMEEEFGEDEGGLSPTEKRHYGQLKAERDTFDDAIGATVKAVLYCQKIGKRITKPELFDYLKDISPDLPVTTMNKIRNALPQQFKKGPGAPLKRTAKQ